MKFSSNQKLLVAAALAIGGAYLAATSYDQIQRNVGLLTAGGAGFVLLGTVL